VGEKDREKKMIFIQRERGLDGKVRESLTDQKQKWKDMSRQTNNLEKKRNQKGVTTRRLGGGDNCLWDWGKENSTIHKRGGDRDF